MIIIFDKKSFERWYKIKLNKKIFDRYLMELEDGFDIFYYSDIGNKNLCPHSHPYYELYLLVAGEIAFHYKDSFFMLKPGDVLLVNKHEIHCSILLDSSVPYERIVLDVSVETLKKLSSSEIDLSECFHLNNHRVFRFPYDVQNLIRLNLGKILTLKQKKPCGHDLLLNSYLTELFVTINQYIKDSAIIPTTDELKPNQLIAVVEQYIIENLDNDIAVEDLAQFVCASKYNFMRTFKKITGQTVYQYIIDKRLETAISLIKSGNDFTTAGLLSGFNDYSCFYRAFKNKYNISPKEFFKDLTTTSS